MPAPRNGRTSMAFGCALERRSWPRALDCRMGLPGRKMSLWLPNAGAPGEPGPRYHATFPSVVIQAHRVLADGAKGQTRHSA